MLPRWRPHWVKYGHLHKQVHRGQDLLRNDLFSDNNRAMAYFEISDREQLLTSFAGDVREA
jgi:hypothetical protein